MLLSTFLCLFSNMGLIWGVLLLLLKYHLLAIFNSSWSIVLKLHLIELDKSVYVLLETKQP